jgi:DNA helicase IV / RNA helicase N terminal
MRQTWGSTTLGQLFTFTKSWSLCLEGERFELSIAGKAVSVAVAQLEKISVKPGAFWAAVRIEVRNGRAFVLNGIANKEAKKLQQVLAASIAVIRRQERVAGLIKEFGPLAAKVAVWADQAKRSCRQQLKDRGWLSHEFKAEVAASRPQALALKRLLSEPEVEQHLGQQE